MQVPGLAARRRAFTLPTLSSESLPSWPWAGLEPGTLRCCCMHLTRIGASRSAQMAEWLHVLKVYATCSTAGQNHASDAALRRRFSEGVPSAGPVKAPGTATGAATGTATDCNRRCNRHCNRHCEYLATGAAAGAATGPTRVAAAERVDLMQIAKPPCAVRHASLTPCACRYASLTQSRGDSAAVDTRQSAPDRAVSAGDCRNLRGRHVPLPPLPPLGPCRPSRPCLPCRPWAPVCLGSHALTAHAL